MARSTKPSRRVAAAQTPAAPRRAPRRVPAGLIDSIIIAALLLMTGVVYVQVRDFEFTNYDDPAYVPDNLHVRDGLSWSGLAWACTTFETANWYPLTWLSLMLDCQLFGPHPGVHHAVNATLHAADALLLFLVLMRMTGRRWPSAAVAALFAVHPAHVESVAWIAERKDVLSTLFFLLSLVAYRRYAARPGLARWIAVFLSMVAGLMCKPMLVTLPLVLLLLDYWPLRRMADCNLKFAISDFQFPESFRHRLWMLVLEKLPLFALSAAVSAVTIAAQASQGATQMLGDQTNLPLRAANAAIAYAKYLAMIAWPVDLAVFYPYDFHPQPAVVAGAAALLVAVTAVVIWQLRRAPYLAVGWFWYLGTLSPTIGLVQVGAQGMADRYTYIPSIGIFLAAAWAAAEFVSQRLVLAAASSAVLAVLMVLTHQQTAYWAGSEPLFRHALAVTGDNAVSCENLGDVLLKHERYADAEVQFRKVLAHDPEHFRQTSSELARALEKQGRIAEAVACLREELQRHDDNAEAMNQLALLLAPQRQVAQAIALLEKARTLAPRQPAVAKNLAWIYATCPDRRFRNGPKAVELARRACDLTHWTDAQYLVALADAYHETGDREQEIEELHAAQKLSPKDAAIAGRLRELAPAKP